MKYVDPKIFMIARTDLRYDETRDMLDYIGARDYQVKALEDAESLVEIAGRMCYKSFVPELNSNVTKVRDDPEEYIGNILKQHHGSVFEHATVTFAFIGVSRILTHELVRHRPGTAFSQESGRFVRLDEFQMYRPDAIGEVLEELGESDQGAVAQTYKDLEVMVNNYEKEFQAFMSTLPWDRMNFHQKKRITSAMRRYAPSGTVNNIIITANHRAWRHMIEVRTSEGAEEEIVKVFYDVASQLADRFPLIYQDMRTTRDSSAITFDYGRV